MFIRVQDATSPADREEIFRFRYRMLVEGSGRLLPEADHARGLATDAADAQARILVAVDEANGAVLGTLRVCLGRDHPLPRALVEHLDLSPMLVAFGEPSVAWSSAYVVDPAYRGLTVASSLLGRLFTLLLEQEVDLDVSSTELSRARTWFQVGYRPIGPPARLPPGNDLELPIVLVARDRAYLSRLGSPLAALLRPQDPDRGAVAARLADLYPNFREQGVTPPRPAELWASVAHASPAARTPSLFAGLDSALLDPLLRTLPARALRANEALPMGGEGRWLLLRGRLGVTAGEGARPFYVSVLEPGEVVGELGSIVTSSRSAVLRALEDSLVQPLPADLLDQLARRDPAAAARVRANLAEIAAARLEALGRQVAGFMRGSPERVPVGQAAPVEPVAPAAQEHAARPDLPLWDAPLLRAGFDDGQVLLDLSADAGDSALELARRFPLARVVRLEPDPAACERAEERAAAAGFEENCSFLAGRAERIPLDAGTVDGAWIRFGLQLAPDPRAVLREIARVVRPGGRVALLETDDDALLVHPEPPGFAAFLARLAATDRALGADRRVGRKLPSFLADAGFDEPSAALLGLDTGLVPLDDLVDAAFGARRRALAQAGLWRAEDEAALEALAALDGEPGAWIGLGLVLATGVVPAPERPR